MKGSLPAHIKTISIDDCQNTYNEYFTPNNAILVIVGDVDPIESFNLITKYFGDIKSSESLPKNPSLTFDATKNKDLDIFEVKNWPMNSYVEIFSIPTPQNKDFIVVDLLEEILNMRSSPYKKFVFDNDYFKEGFIYYNPKLGNGQFGFILESETVNTNFKKHEKAIKKTLKNLAKNGIEEAFLKVTINREKMDIYRVNSSVLWMAQMLARHEMKYGGYNTFFDNVQLYENITNEDIKRVVNKYFINGYKLVIKDKN